MYNMINEGGFHQFIKQAFDMRKNIDSTRNFFIF